MSSQAELNVFTTQEKQFENIFKSLQWWEDNHHFMITKKDDLRDDGGYHSGCNQLYSQFKDLCICCNDISSEQFVLFCKTNEMFRAGIQVHNLQNIVDMSVLGRAGNYWSDQYPLDSGRIEETDDISGCTYEVPWRGILTCDADIVCNSVVPSIIESTGASVNLAPLSAVPYEATPLKPTVATIQGAPLQGPRLNEQDNDIEETYDIAGSPMVAPLIFDDLAAPVMKRTDSVSSYGLPSLDDDIAVLDSIPRLIRQVTEMSIDPEEVNLEHAMQMGYIVQHP